MRRSKDILNVLLLLNVLINIYLPFPKLTTSLILTKTFIGSIICMLKKELKELIVREIVQGHIPVIGRILLGTQFA